MHNRLERGACFIKEDQDMSEGKTICVVCAWRADCLKKYSYDSSGPVKCPDYTRDVTIKDDEEEDQDK